MGDSVDATSRLRQAAAAQQLAYRRLQELLRQLRNTAVEARAEVGFQALREQQQDLNIDTRATWMHQVADQPPAAAASPEALSLRQREIGRRLDEMQQDLEQLQSSASEWSDKARQALSTLKQNAVSGLMSQSERALSQNRLAEAQETQRKILQAIKAAEAVASVSNQQLSERGAATGAEPIDRRRGWLQSQRANAADGDSIRTTTG